MPHSGLEPIVLPLRRSLERGRLNGCVTREEMVAKNLKYNALNSNVISMMIRD